MILHQLEQRVDGLFAKIPPAILWSECIGFVNKQCAAECIVNYFGEAKYTLALLSG